MCRTIYNLVHCGNGSFVTCYMGSRRNDTESSVIFLFFLAVRIFFLEIKEGFVLESVLSVLCLCCMWQILDAFGGLISKFDLLILLDQCFNIEMLQNQCNEGLYYQFKHSCSIPFHHFNACYFDPGD